MLQGIYFILVESMPDKYRKAYALTKFWMNRFCHTACCMLHICAAEQAILWNSHHSYNAIHATYTTYSTCLLSSDIGGITGGAA